MLKLKSGFNSFNKETKIMICPNCKNQYDIYNATVNDDTGLWECPDCLIPLNDDDAKDSSKDSNNNREVENVNK